MARTLSTAFRKSIEMRDSPALILCFVTIDHDDLAATLRIVSEDVNGISRSANGAIINYNLGGNLYQGLPFYFDLITDNDRAPLARMAIPDIDKAIGLALIETIESPVLTLKIYNSADWGTTLDGSNARSPTGTPTVVYSAPYLRMRNTGSDQVILQGDLMSFDYTNEPWPYHRATKDLVPGAYW